MGSKGNIFNFIEDAASNPKLHKKMAAVINSRGKGMTANKLVSEFHRLGYDGVCLRDCKKILDIVKRAINPADWDWSY